ncbi:coiled-coil domain-containing protein 97-like isoform X2 [Antedon mediterranea]|uniref:coiled-coil domain-containing protein 97-like isoform X2 n=1 Tax=Antedon mediterranea TaxID=105859 RepID=UPI003AF9AC7F
MATYNDDESVTSSSVYEMHIIEKRMFENIACSGARISSQQKDETDLTLEEKVVILKKLFEEKPSIFAERFHMYLTDDDLVAFDDKKQHYEVDYYLNEAKKRLSSKNSMVVKNRRYEALKKLEKDGVYFGDEAMNERAPFMYDYYVGQYQSEAEKKERPYDNVHDQNLKFSTVLIDFMQRKEREALFKRQREEEECMESEEDEDTEDEEDEKEKGDDDKEEQITENENEQNNIDDQPHSSQQIMAAPEPISEEEKHMLRQEFMSRMRERFLNGEDEDFDYASVDFNSDYDSVETRTQDEQEKYFDGD